MSFSSHLKKSLTEFLKHLVGLHSEQSILDRERELRDRGRERQQPAFSGGRARLLLLAGRTRRSPVPGSLLAELNSVYRESFQKTLRKTGTAGGLVSAT